MPQIIHAAYDLLYSGIFPEAYHANTFCKQPDIFLRFSPSPEIEAKKERKNVNPLLSYHLLLVVVACLLRPKKVELSYFTATYDDG
jgi:hypothetical protein